MIYEIRAYFKAGKPQPPERSEAYKRFIRTFPCVCCGSSKRIEAAHFGPHGMSQKASDLDCLPLCNYCHQTGPKEKTYHKMKPSKFAWIHNIDVLNLQQMFQGWWREKKGKAA